MQLKHKIQSVNLLFTELDRELIRFKKDSGLICDTGCGDCCMKNDINATILEFLPAVYNIYQRNGHEDLINRLENTSDTRCAFYTPLYSKGFCANYEGRGLICRLFGFSVRTNKYGDKSLITCKRLKNKTNPVVLEKTIDSAPEVTSYYMKLFGIDPSLAIQLFPINIAIKKALETVMMYYQFKKRRA